MMPNDSTFLLVIPAFKESHRLPAFLAELLPAIRDSEHTVRVRVVDDGSGAREQDFLKQHIQSLQEAFCFLEDPVLNAVHHGKGYAVYTGWRRPPIEADFLVFVDADGSIAPADLLRLVQLAVDSAEPALLLAGSRRPSPYTVVRRRFSRRLLNRLFAWIVDHFFRLAVYDPQCGCKIISERYLRSIDGDLREHGFCFDVELLAHARADGVPIREEPINWTHMQHNRIHLVKDGIQMLLEVRRLHRRLAPTL